MGVGPHGVGSRRGAGAASRSAVFGLSAHCSLDLAGRTDGGRAFFPNSSIPATSLGGPLDPARPLTTDDDDDATINRGFLGGIYPKPCDLSSTSPAPEVFLGVLQRAILLFDLAKGRARNSFPAQKGRAQFFFAGQKGLALSSRNGDLDFFYRPKGASPSSSPYSPGANIAALRRKRKKGSMFVKTVRDAKTATL